MNRLKGWLFYGNYQFIIFVVGGTLLAVVHAVNPLDRELVGQEVYETAVNLDGDYAHGWYNLGVIAEEEGDASKALEYYRIAGAADPHDNTPCFNWARLEIKSGNPDEAIAVLQRLQKTNRHDPATHSMMADAYMVKGDTVSAIQSLTKVLDLDDERIDDWLRLADASLAGGQVREAEAAYRELLQRDPTHSAALNNLAGVIRKDGRVEEAAKLLERAITSEPGNKNPYGQLALIRLSQTRHQEARELLLTLLQIDPNDQNARQLLSQIPE